MRVYKGQTSKQCLLVSMLTSCSKTRCQQDWKWDSRYSLQIQKALLADSKEVCPSFVVRGVVLSVRWVCEEFRKNFPRLVCVTRFEVQLKKSPRSTQRTHVDWFQLAFSSKLPEVKKHLFSETVGLLAKKVAPPTDALMVSNGVLIKTGPGVLLQPLQSWCQ